MTVRPRRGQNRHMRNLLALLMLSVAWPAFAVDDAFSQCRQIEDVEERVTCYDDLVDSRNAAASDEVPSAQSLFGTDDAEARQIVETTLAIEQIDQIEARVAEVRESAGEKLIVTLDNEQVWRQLDSKPLLLKSGETVIIRKASFSSFLLEKSSGSRSIRVKRVN